MEEAKFTYESFDRQVLNLEAMARTVINGWEDYSSMEMNLDLRSLRIKAAKVCFLADEDHALQKRFLMCLTPSANVAVMTTILQ